MNFDILFLIGSLPVLSIGIALSPDYFNFGELHIGQIRSPPMFPGDTELIVRTLIEAAGPPPDPRTLIGLLLVAAHKVELSPDPLCGFRDAIEVLLRRRL